MVVALPHHTVVGSSCDLGTYPSVDGAPRVCATRELTVDAPFGDYLVMYLALADPAAALADLGQVSDRSIDGANSRAYLTAWLLSRASAS